MREEKEVKKLGNSGYILVPKKFIGQKLIVTDEVKQSINKCNIDYDLLADEVSKRVIKNLKYG